MALKYRNGILIWRERNGEEYPITAMHDGHLNNAIKVMKNAFGNRLTRLREVEKERNDLSSSLELAKKKILRLQGEHHEYDVKLRALQEEKQERNKPNPSQPKCNTEGAFVQSCCSDLTHHPSNPIITVDPCSICFSRTLICKSNTTPCILKQYYLIQHTE